MNRKCWPRLECEARIKAGDPVCVGGWDREPPAGVLQRSAAHPAHVILHGVQHGQQEVTTRTDGLSAVGKVIVRLNSSTAVPQGLGRAEKSVDSGDLLGCRRPPGGPDVQLVGRDRDQLVDPDRARLELGGAGLGIGGVDGEDVGGDLVGKVEGHEGEARPQRRIKADGRLN